MCFPALIAPVVGALGIGGATAAVAAPTAGALGAAATGFAAASATAATAASAAQAAFTISSLLGVATSFVSFIQQSQNADAQEDFQREQSRSATTLARQDAILNYDALGSRVAEERTAAGVEIQRVAREARRAIGTVRASGTGVAGQALDNLVADFELKESEFRTGIQGNLKSSEAQALREGRAIEQRSKGRILAARRVPVTRPSFLAATLRAGVGVFDSYLENTIVGPTGVRSFGTV